MFRWTNKISKLFQEKKGRIESCLYVHYQHHVNVQNCPQPATRMSSFALSVNYTSTLPIPQLTIILSLLACNHCIESALSKIPALFFNIMQNQDLHQHYLKLALPQALALFQTLQGVRLQMRIFSSKSTCTDVFLTSPQKHVVVLIRSASPRCF